MLYSSNNDYDLETIEVWTKEPFEIGSTRMGRAADRNWLVHFVNDTTLMIAPEHEPGAWKPAHIYGCGERENEMQGFVLTPSERESAQLEAFEKVAEIDLSEIKDAIDAVEDEMGPDVECDLFGGLHAELNQARAILVAAKAKAAALYDTKCPPRVDEPCKLPSSRSRR